MEFEVKPISFELHKSMLGWVLFKEWKTGYYLCGGAALLSGIFIWIKMDKMGLDPPVVLAAFLGIIGVGISGHLDASLNRLFALQKEIRKIQLIQLNESGIWIYRKKTREFYSYDRVNAIYRKENNWLILLDKNKFAVPVHAREFTDKQYISVFDRFLERKCRMEIQSLKRY